jgi:dTMP kinase
VALARCRCAARGGGALSATGAARGFFVALEGIDGSGKSVQCARLAAALRERGESVLQTREPTDGPWGRRYRAWARGEFECSPADVLGFFIEDRREHLALHVLPALARGELVVCDRYEASTRAYQAAHGVERAALADALARAAAQPADLVLWLRLPVAAALARLRPRQAERAPAERYERAEFLERVDAEYAALALCAIDASRAEAEVTRELLDRVVRALEVRRRGAA